MCCATEINRNETQESQFYKSQITLKYLSFLRIGRIDERSVTYSSEIDCASTSELIYYVLTFFSNF